MPSVQPSRQSILLLYSATLRASRSFSSYNFKEYFIRRARVAFRCIQRESDPEKITSLYSEAIADLAVLRRSAVVNRLFDHSKVPVDLVKRTNNV